MNRKGSAMVEAAVVFPVVILSLLATMGILMFLLDEATSQADMHQAVMSEAGRATDTYIGTPGPSTVSVKSGWSGIYRGMHGETFIRFHGFFLLPRSFDKTQNCSQFLVDERKYARYIDLFTTEDRNDAHESQNNNQ